MSFAKEMLVAQKELEKFGHSCFIPDGVEEYVSGAIVEIGGSERASRKVANNLIKKHYDLIAASDAILVLNYDKRNTRNYIGGNAFLEIGFAHILDKKIFFLNDIPDVDFMREELEAVQPVILKGDLSLIS